MQRIGLSTMLALVVAILIAGCGGGSAADSEISSTLKTWGTAFAQLRDHAACAEMSSAEQATLVKAGKLIAAKDPGLTDKLSSCAPVLRFDGEGLDASERKALEKVSVSDIKVSGASATAKIQGSGSVSLQRIGGKWLISGGLGG